MKKLNQSKKILILQFVFIFAILLFANHFTFLSRDDFVYSFHCQTLDKLETLGDYISSVAYNTKVANGRYIAHFLAQVSLNMPKSVFNIINSLMYCLQIFLCYIICNIGADKENNVLLLGIFGATWVYEPLFGDVNLWVTGACNYMWAIVVCLAFIYPFYRKFMTGKDVHSTVAIVLFVILSFLAGAWSEATSAAAIFISFFLLLLLLLSKQRPAPYLVISFVSAIIGYATLVFSPNELSAKTSFSGIYMLFQNFKYCVELYSGFLPLLLVYIALLVIAVNQKNNKKFIIVSLLCFVTSLFAIFIFTFASYIPGRCIAATSIFLVLAIGILAGSLYSSGENTWSVIVPLLIVPSLLYNLVFGLDDIRLTDYKARQVVKYINQCKASGQTEAKYPLIAGKTTYSIYYSDLPYQINTVDSEGWPNMVIANYFGLDRVIGVESIDEIEEIPPIL